MSASKASKNRKKPHNSQKYYKDVLAHHRIIIAKTRNLVEIILNRLHVEIDEFSALEQSADEQIIKDSIAQHSKKFWFGDKESATSVLAKLSSIILRLIPLEQEIASLDASKSVSKQDMEQLTEQTELLEEDMEILERYIKNEREKEF